MTGQTLLDYMELVNAELQLQPGEEDVTKGLRALNIAQDYLENYIALWPKCFGGSVGTVTTSASTESTTFPAGLMRIDRLQYIDPTTSRPAWDLDKRQRAGGHAPSSYWPLVAVSATTTGKPRAYWTNGTSIYWDPLPDATHTVRYYGFASASDIAASGTFAYPDITAFPVATLAAQIMKVGIDDDPSSMEKIISQTLRPAVDSLRMFNRDGAVGFEYTEIHNT